jgi:hypothetical protein
MNAKKCLIVYTVSIFLGYVFLWVLVFIINPTYKYDNRIIKNNKIGFSEGLSKSLYTKLKKRKYTLVFGTSRSRFIDSKMLGKQTLNFHSIYGNPNSVYSLLNQLDDNQLNNIEHIYYLIDLHIMKSKTDKDSYYEFIDYKDSSINLLDSVLLSINDIENSIKSIVSSAHISSEGSPVGITKDLTTKGGTLLNPMNDQAYSMQAINTVKKINTLCKNKGIKITYITPTFPDFSLKRINLDVERDKWSKLLLNNKIDSFYALWMVDGVSDLKNDNTYLAFEDEKHLNYKYLDHVINNIVMNKTSRYKINNINDLDNTIEHIKNKLYTEQ